MPTVSVIVPNYNHARFLRQRIDSILGQTYQDFELILLDDASTDESRTILREYASGPKVTHVEFNETNSGSTFKQWNKGVQLATGEYAWIAESDDYADARLLETLVRWLDSEPSAVLAYCRSWEVSADDEIRGLWDSHISYLDPSRWTTDFSADSREECRRYLVHCNTVQSASSVVFRREVYVQVGGADETLVLGGDWKTWASMALAGGTIAHAGEALNYCRFHERSVSERAKRSGTWAAEALRVVAWLLGRVTVGEVTRARVADELSSLWIPLVLSRQVLGGRRWEILRDATTIDPRALRRLSRAALTAGRLTIRRRWRSLRAASSALE